MSMMMRRGTAATSPVGQDGGLGDPGADIRFPENAGVSPAVWPVAEVRARLEAFGPQRFSGYLLIRRMIKNSGAEGLILLHNGKPIIARAGAIDGPTALAQLLAPDTMPEILCATHSLAEGAVLALASSFRMPELVQAMGKDGSEVAMLLRDLAAVKHSGTVQISANGGRDASAWVRILMFEGKFLGVFSSKDRQLKPSLSDVNQVLTESSPELALFSIQGVPPALALPPAVVVQQELAYVPAPGASAARDELLETDLVWFMSRFERAFTRLKDRRDPQGDLLRAFGELTNELAGFVAALQSGEGKGQAALGVVTAELARARSAGVISVDLKVGKAGLDAVAVAKGYSSLPRRSPAAVTYFMSASADMLTLIEWMMERMLGAFHDPTTASFAREGCETLLREVRGGLAELAQN